MEAEIWAFSTKHNSSLSISFLQSLHKKMFDKTWRWAGTFRKSNKNIGVDKILIAIELKKLLDDTQHQITANTYSTDEIATRFHHRLVSIHPFANGNGRHSRLMTDILLVTHEQPRFTWGNKNLYSKNEAREQYIRALR